ncbi:MAG: hypothetical protein KH431_07415 [Erysipelotrichaceae bacterium]|nr:hypothetical protein [Erysipelotrichaceae bacterium]
MMKKFFKVFFVAVMVLSLAACGGKDSTDAQKKAVNTFFTYMKKADFDKIKGIMTDDGYKDVEDLQKMAGSSFDEMLDAETYGDEAAKSAQKYIDYVFEKLFKDTKIKEVEVKDGKTIIKVKGKMASFDELKNIESSTEIQNLATDFENNEENKKQAMEIYLSQGQDAMMKYIYNSIMPKFFEEAIKLIDKSSYNTYNATFTLIEKDGKWLIDKIK